MGPRTGLNILENRKISCPCRDSNPGTSSPRPSCSTYSTIPAPFSVNTLGTCVIACFPSADCGHIHSMQRL